MIIHRVGTLYPGDNIVFAATASAYRKDASAGCQSPAPFWKKNKLQKALVVESKQSDAKAAAKWLK